MKFVSDGMSYIVPGHRWCHIVIYATSKKFGGQKYNVVTLYNHKFIWMSPGKKTRNKIDRGKGQRVMFPAPEDIGADAEWILMVLGSC
jgi:hypothetical protein